MRFESIQYSKCQNATAVGLRPDPAGKAYSVSQNPWGRYSISQAKILVVWATMYLAAPVFVGL